MRPVVHEDDLRGRVAGEPDKSWSPPNNSNNSKNKDFVRMNKT
jgi:hypothetical protein